MFCELIPPASCDVAMSTTEGIGPLDGIKIF